MNTGRCWIWIRLLPIVLLAALLFSSSARGTAVAPARVEAIISSLESYYGPGILLSRTFVGSEICLACHTEQSGWRTTMHATGFYDTSTDTYSLQDKFGVVADYDQNGVDDFKQGLDFNTISSVFDAYKPNAPVLGFDEQRGYTITIGQLTLDVRFGYGASGLYKERFVVKVPTVDGPGGYSRGHYVSPVQFNEVPDEYTAYHPEDWYNDDGTPKYTPATTMAEIASGRSFDRKCAGCHFTGFNISKSPEGEWLATAPQAILPEGGSPHYYDMNGDGFAEEINTGCERCHGAGARHVVNRGDPQKIINPERDFTALQANQLCGSCHNRGKSKPDGMVDYPYDETTQTGYQFALGEPLDEAFFNSNPGLWPDGKHSKKHRQQWPDFEKSSKPEFQFHMVRCYECHDVHVDNLHNIRETIVEEGSDGSEIEIATRVEDNTQCLACHATHGPFEELTPEDIADPVANHDKIADVVERHTNHYYGPERILGMSRCTTCHMPKTAKSAIAYDIAAHTFEAIPPEKTLMLQEQGGMPNSCASCHRDFARLFGLPEDGSLTDWAEPSDVRLSEFLMRYFGPDGIWWNTSGGEEPTETSSSGESAPAALRANRRRAR